MQSTVEQIDTHADYTHTDYGRIADAIHYLENHYQQQPTLDELAEYLHLSPFHLQRLFTRWAGVSPKRFLQYLTAGHAKTLLTSAHSVLDATYESGLSSPGRLHDLMIATEAVTPGEYKSSGAGITITYGRHTTPFGDALIAVTKRGICALSFIDDNLPARSWESTLGELQTRWQAATLIADEAETAHHATTIAMLMQGHFRSPENLCPIGPAGDVVQNFSGKLHEAPIQLLLKGTNFQLKVWEALLQIPTGAVWSYEDVAKTIGNPNAVRAVGNAVGANPIGYLIPCHRVIRKSGIIDGYHWGTTRKKALLAWEAARGEAMRQVA